MLADLGLAISFARCVAVPYPERCCGTQSQAVPSMAAEAARALLGRRLCLILPGEMATYGPCWVDCHVWTSLGIRLHATPS